MNHDKPVTAVGTALTHRLYLLLAQLQSYTQITRLKLDKWPQTQTNIQTTKTTTDFPSLSLKGRWEGLGSQVSAADTVRRQLDSFCGISLDSDSFSQDPSCCGFYYYKPPRTAPFRKLEALRIQRHREQAGLFLLHN